MQASFLLILYVAHTPDSHLFSLIIGWASGSWFQISRNLLAYLPEFIAMRINRIWSSRMDKARKTHTYILGRSGSGKSVTMEMFLYRDVQCGNGVALIEPHGELTERFLHFDLFKLGHPSKAYERLVIFDLEGNKPTAFNIFHVPLPKDAIERQIRIDEIASSYLPAFHLALRPEMSEAMVAMLKNCITAVFYLPNPSFLDLLKLLADPSNLEPRYAELFDKLPNHVLKDYFSTDFFAPKVETTKKPLRDRLRNLLVQRQIQVSFLAKENAIDFADLLQKGKILVVRARKDRVGEQTCQMVGNLIHQFLYFSAFRRMGIPGEKKPFFCYMDECQNYINDTVISGVSEARKFGFHYVLANQYMNQGLTDNQQKALMSCNVKICGNIIYEDAVKMSKEMGIEKYKRRFKWLRAGEFFIHSKGRFPIFTRFPSTFALPQSKLGRVSHSVYMRTSEHEKLMKALKQKPGQAKAEPVLNAIDHTIVCNTLSQNVKIMYTDLASMKSKVSIIQQLDTTKFQLNAI